MHIIELKLRFKGDFFPSEVETIMLTKFATYNVEHLNVIRGQYNTETEVTITKR